MNKIIKYLEDIFCSIRNEANIVFGDFGIFLITALAIVIYGFLYSYSYSTEILEKTPVAVVDNDNSKYSREFIQRLSHTQNVEVSYEPQDLKEAEELMYDRKVYGILYFKKGFEKDIMNGKTGNFAIYADGSYFLAYKQVFIAANFVMMEMSKQINDFRYSMAGMPHQKAEFLSRPIDMQHQLLYNRYQGYGSFLMPAILMLIIQQTILMSCGMVAGKIREKNWQKDIYYSPDGRKYNSSSIIIGKAIFLCIVNIPLWAFVMTYIYTIFGLPALGNIWEVMALIIPYILSSTFLGLGMATFYKYRESVILYMFFTSIVFLLLTGVSWPQSGMPELMVWFSYLIPSTSAVNGFIWLQTMGANMSNISNFYWILWALTAVFFIFALICYRKRIK